MKHLFTILAILLAANSVQAIELWQTSNPSKRLYSDDPNIPHQQDERWQTFTQILEEQDAQIWFHQELDLRHFPDEVISNPLSLSVRVNGSYEFYWDGNLIGSNLNLGESAPQYSRILLPVSALSEGIHQLHMRIHSSGMPSGANLELSIQPAAVKSGTFGIHFTVITTLFVAVTSLVVCIYLLIIWWTRKNKKGLLIAALISFCCGLIILIDEGRFLFNFPYLLQLQLDRLLPPTAILFSLALPWFVLVQIQAQKKLLWMLSAPIAIALGTTNALPYEQDIQVFFFLSIFTGLISLWHINRQAFAAKFFALAFFAAGFLILLDWGKHWFLAAIIVMIASYLARDIKQQSHAVLRSKLTAERLRADLIKRNIQPHFLMNSLTVLMEWVETEPTVAVEFIEGLADEFRLLSQFAEEDSVPIEDEIELCTTHIHLMNMRLDASLALETDLKAPKKPVPPALFHTLLENAFSHNNYAGSKAQFSLKSWQQDNKTTYELITPIVGSGKALGTGAGTKYVLARLKEFCGTNFTFSSNQVGSDWITSITLPSGA